MDYKPWFYKYYRYLTGNRNGTTTYNSTRFIDAIQRYSKVESLEREQPYGVVGNVTGFDKLIDLLTKSNYSFEDVNDSLIKTYKENIENAMGRQLVNTNSSIFHCTNKDKKYVSSNVNNPDYRLIEVPFDQLHFGNRDEFIRQKLQKMNHWADNTFVHMNEFLSKDINDLLGFTVMITTNGKICNDWYIAFNDHGFMFKVSWRVGGDVDFIIYMLSDCYSHKIRIKTDELEGNLLPSNLFAKDMRGLKCIIDMYDPQFQDSARSVPCFGVFDDNNNLSLTLQSAYIRQLLANNASTLDCVVYTFKYAFEVPSVYPAVNYMDIMDARRVYDDTKKNVITDEGKRVLSSVLTSNELEVCTPPICIDRPVDISFRMINNAMDIYNSMMEYNDTIRMIGDALRGEVTDIVLNNVRMQISGIYYQMYSLYNSYLQGAILTSLVTTEYVETFKQFIDNLTGLMNCDINNWQDKTFDELYDSNYAEMVRILASPFNDKRLEPIRIINSILNKFWNEDSNIYQRFNRPIPSECFIAFKYSRDEEAWLFDYPSIDRFKGISNTFYIGDNLKGDELFKFIVLYSESDNADDGDKYVEPFSLETIFDFDKFMVEAEKHIGYIRYWHNENKLMKLNKFLYDREKPETYVAVLSKILKGKVDSKDLLEESPSEILYDTAGISTSAFNYNESSDNAPLVINYLFYTVQMMKNNKDQLEQYFLRHLTNDTFLNSYVDLDVNALIKENKHTNKVNFSVIHQGVSSLDTSASSLPVDSKLHVFDGLPLLVRNGQNQSSMYDYVFNEYESNVQYPMVGDERWYAAYSNPENNGYAVKPYTNDVRVCALVMDYIRYTYECYNDIFNCYDKPYRIDYIIKEHINELNKIIDKLKAYDGEEFIYYGTQTVITDIIDDENPLMDTLSNIMNVLSRIDRFIYHSKNTSPMEFINRQVLGTIRYVYKSFGFKSDVYPNLRRLYMQLKRFNHKLSVHELREWTATTDYTVLRDLDDHIAYNENYDLPDDTFSELYLYMRTMMIGLMADMNEYDTYTYAMSGDIQTNHLTPLLTYVDLIRSSYIFDLYNIYEFRYDYSKTYNGKPYVGIITVTRNDYFQPPVLPPSGTAINLVFALEVDQLGTNGKYVIRNIDKLCEYIVFKPGYIETTMTIKDEDNNTLDTIAIILTFRRVASTGDIFEAFDQISYIGQTNIDVENTHDTFTIQNGKVINNEFANMNYELMVHNNFKPLDHVTEMLLDPDTYTPGAVDRIQIPNCLINQFVNRKLSNDSSLWFKASRVIHPQTSVFGKYFVGQRIYLQSEDLYIFPCIVTAIDHSTNGFMEVEVDHVHAKWFKPPTSLVTKYLTTDVTCFIIPDNIMNWYNEYSNEEYMSRPIVPFNEDIFVDKYELPGDPLYVTSNAPYVYHRLIQPERTPLPDDYGLYNITFIGSYEMSDVSEKFTINCINHNYNKISESELYPILRDDTNAHDIADIERDVFKANIDICDTKILNKQAEKNRYIEELKNITDQYRRQHIIFLIESIDLEITYQQEQKKRLQGYIDQLESPTTWFNVESYDAAITYITNGRGKPSFPYHVDFIHDIAYEDTLSVLIYNQTTHEWIDPSTYSITKKYVNGSKYDVKDEYTEDFVLYSIDVESTTPFQGILNVYVGYKQSDIFHGKYTHGTTCSCRFKPHLSLSAPITDYDPYKYINVRKHCNGKEVYSFDSYSEDIENFNEDGFYIERPLPNGQYNSPPLRMCDISVKQSSNEYDYTHFDLWIPNPFKDIEMDLNTKIHTYTATINQPIEYLDVEDGVVNVKLLCINNNHFNGNISDITFDADVYMDYESVSQQITVKSSSLPISANTNDYVCTVVKSDDYKPIGGIITVSDTVTSTLVDNNDWIKIPDDYVKYRIIPEKCVITPKDVTFASDIPIYITLKSEYSNNYSDTIQSDNSNVFNPFEYYYDYANNVRLPISNIRLNRPNQRLTTSTNVHIVKANYIGVCRYSLQHIPQSGIIDLTGYIPSPLSRERYQFWVNGEDKSYSSNLHILSPTSIQLTDLTSLRNFELIEIVYDYDESLINKYGTVYVDLDGNMYSSYKYCLQHNINIQKQTLQFTFDVNLHTHLQDYTSCIINNPNNVDTDVDILTYVSTPTPSSYNEIYNIPQINGIPLYHPTWSSLGLHEIKRETILNKLDEVWKKEILTNKDFGMTHRDGMYPDAPLKLHVKKNIHSTSDEDYYIAYVTGLSNKYISMYITNNESDRIYDTTNTLRVMTLIHVGVSVYIDRSFENKWLHITDNTLPLKIQ